jgi:hypothetical protein
MTRLNPLVWSRAFASMLKGDVKGYANMHRNFYDALETSIEGLRRSDAKTVESQLHFLSESELDIDKEPVEGTQDMCLLLSTLEDRFKREGVRAGTIFIDTFKETHRFAHLFLHCYTCSLRLCTLVAHGRIR